MRHHDRSIGWTTAAAMIGLLSLARPALAIDGVIEINQARALAGGITASDTPGFPITIDASGSYRLTGNLTVDDTASAIDIGDAAKDVTIDLNGYAILGPVVCASPPTCTGHSSVPAHPGIRDHNPTDSSVVRVRNGMIRGIGGDGIFVHRTLVAEHLQVRDSAGSGIAGGNDSSVSDVVAENNGGAGINVTLRSWVRGCTANGNGNTGISAENDALIADNSATNNHQGGIIVEDGATIVGNTVGGNSSPGGFSGIYGGVGVTVIDNAIRSNAFAGIHITSGGYGGNVLTNNNGGDGNAQVSGGGLQIGTNFCGTSTTCP